MDITQCQECPKCEEFPKCEECPKCDLEKMLKDKTSVEKILIDKINSTKYTDKIGNFMLKKIISNQIKEDIIYNTLKALCTKENANTFVNDEIISLLIQQNDIRKIKIVSEIKEINEKYKLSLEKILNETTKRKYLKYKNKFLKLREIPNF